MKKFAKLVAVFAALMLALACFVACSDGEDDDSGSVQALQGLWIDERGEGYYFVGDIYHQVQKGDDGKYFYYEKYGDKFSVSGNKLTMYWHNEGDECEFSIDGDILTMKSYYEENEEWETDTFKKVTGKPVPYEESDEFDDSSNGGDGSDSNSGSNSGTNSGSVKALQGLWIDGYGYGYYFDGNIYYQVWKDDGKYYYNYEYGDKFSVSGNKLKMYWYDDEDKKHYWDEYEFAIDGGTFTLRYYYEENEEWETDTFKKVTEKPIPYEESDDEE